MNRTDNAVPRKKYTQQDMEDEINDLRRRVARLEWELKAQHQAYKPDMKYKGVSPY